MNTDACLSQVKMNLARFPQVSLVAVVKNRSLSEIQELIDATGLKSIAFNRVQEAQEKLPRIRYFGECRLIGHLQKNKVKKAVLLFDAIDSVDSLPLAQKIGEEAVLAKKIFPILLQVKTPRDSAKQGFSFEEILFSAFDIARISGISVRGLMTMGPLKATEDEIRFHFRSLRQFFEKLKQSKIFGNDFQELSMGMSGDYHLALEEGATMIRVGQGLFPIHKP